MVMSINKLSKADLLLYKDYLANMLYSEIHSVEYRDHLLSEYKKVCIRLEEINNGKE